MGRLSGVKILEYFSIIPIIDRVELMDLRVFTIDMKKQLSSLEISKRGSGCNSYFLLLERHCSLLPDLFDEPIFHLRQKAEYIGWRTRHNKKVGSIGIRVSNLYNLSKQVFSS